MNDPRDSKLKNVVLISLDCVRCEALECYPQDFSIHVGVPPRNRTPTIENVLGRVLS